MLRLIGRVVSVRNVERGSPDVHVQAQRVRDVGMKVEAVEERLAVPLVVQRLELGRIEVAIRPHRAQRQEVPDGVRAAADAGVEDRRGERSVAGGHRTRRLRLVETGLGDDVHDEAALVAVLGGRHAGDDLHRLHRLWRNLIRVDTALLIRNRLVVDGELRLRVVADRMEEAVRVGHDAGRGERNRLIEAADRLERQLVDE